VLFELAFEHSRSPLLVAVVVAVAVATAAVAHTTEIQERDSNTARRCPTHTQLPLGHSGTYESQTELTAAAAAATAAAACSLTQATR
jgi:hypothetical protein